MCQKPLFTILLIYHSNEGIARIFVCQIKIIFLKRNHVTPNDMVDAGPMEVGDGTVLSQRTQELTVFQRPSTTACQGKETADFLI